ASGRTVPVEAGRRRQLTGRAHADARVIVVEDEGARVLRIAGSADSGIARAEITRRIEWRRVRWPFAHLGARPGPRLPVCRDDDPFLAQRVPTLLPHGG